MSLRAFFSQAIGMLSLRITGSKYPRLHYFRTKELVLALITHSYSKYSILFAAF